MESDFYNHNITTVKAGVKRRAADDLQSDISQVNTGLPCSVCVVACAFIKAVSLFQTSKA